MLMTGQAKLNQCKFHKILLHGCTVCITKSQEQKHRYKVRKCDIKIKVIHSSIFQTITCGLSVKFTLYQRCRYIIIIYQCGLSVIFC